MEYSDSASEMIRELGGEKNIARVTHCMTRLRFNLRDGSKIDDQRIEAINGVLGVMKMGSQYQIILGSDVAKYYSQVIKLGNFSENS